MPTIDGLKGFRTLSPADRQVVAAATREVRVPAGKVLFGQGQAADTVWAVKEGLIRIVKHGPGGRQIVLEVIPPGELFGAIAALDNRPYPASAIAAEPSVVWRMPAALACDLCAKHPTLRVAILDQVTSRLRSAHDRLRSVALERIEQRLARMLLALQNRIGKHKDGVTVLSVTRQELADMVGTTVETTIRVTSKWQQAGVVRSARHRIELVDLHAIEEIAEGHVPDGDG